MADAEELQEHEAPEVCMKRIHAKEIIVVKARDTFIFPCGNGMIKLARKDSEVRTSNQFDTDPKIWINDHPREEDDTSDLAEQQQAMEAKNDFWCISGNIFYRHHVQERQQLHVLQEHSFPVPLKHIDDVG